MAMSPINTETTAPVAGGLLALFQKGTGYYHDGYCRTGPDDAGNHSIAATLTEPFLSSPNASGDYKDSSPGDKTCLSAHDFAKWIQSGGDGGVPAVHLHASHDKALEVVGYKDLKRYAAAAEAGGSSGRQEGHHSPETPGGVAKEHHSIGGDDRMAPGAGKSQNSTGEQSSTAGQRG